MVGTSNSIKGVLTDFPMSILPNIVGEPTRESLIKNNRQISGNSDLGGGRHGHLVLAMNMDDYLAQTVDTFAPPHNPVNYPPTMENDQEQALITEGFQQNQALFQRCTVVDRVNKN